MKAITPKQWHLYEFIVKYYKSRKAYPSMGEMSKEMGVSTGTIKERLNALEKKDYLKRIRNEETGKALSRSYELLVKG